MALELSFRVLNLQLSRIPRHLTIQDSKGMLKLQAIDDSMLIVKHQAIQDIELSWIAKLVSILDKLFAIQDSKGK